MLVKQRNQLRVALGLGATQNPQFDNSIVSALQKLQLWPNPFNWAVLKNRQYKLSDIIKEVQKKKQQGTT